MKRFIFIAALGLSTMAWADAEASLDVDVDASAKLGLELGVDHSFKDGLLMSTYLRGVFPVDSGVTAGARFGITATDGLALHSLPLDGFVRFDLGDAYFEGLVGPHWMTRKRDFDAHVALGAGFDLAGLSLGLEAGWLNPAPVIGARAAFAF